MVEVWKERSSQSQDWGVTHRGAVEKQFTWNCWTKGCSPLYIVVWCVPIAGYFGYVFTESLTQADLFPAPSDATVNESVSDHTKFCTSCILLLHIRNDGCSHVDSQHDVFLRWLLLASAVLVIICCLVMYCRVSDWLLTYEERALFPVEGDGFSRKHLRGVRFTARSMVLVIVLCWSPALLLLGLSFVETVPQERLFPLYVLQALTVSLQGFLDSIVYAWLRRNFREAVLGEGVPLLARVPEAFFDDSLSRVR
ncbi:uncharacterized protein LOC108942199 [Scleropages formosus]|nr:uncharacterized protein LOC108942199 [Scleropages formosus]